MLSVVLVGYVLYFEGVT